MFLLLFIFYHLSVHAMLHNFHRNWKFLVASQLFAAFVEHTLIIYTLPTTRKISCRKWDPEFIHTSLGLIVSEAEQGHILSGKGQ